MRALLLVAVAACAPAAAAPASPIPATARELITAVPASWNAKQATLRRFRRDGASWVAVGDPWPGVLGASGAAWGRGLHGEAAPSGRRGPRKREGDGRSPAGAFALRGSYGYADAAPKGTRLAYTPTTAAQECVDDPRSQHYDRIVDRGAVAAPDWKSSESMRRRDALYTWVIDVAHNPAHAPGGGSCIFLHVWRDARSGTAGCTAMAPDILAALLATLDPSAVFVLLPRADYAALAPAWGLPALAAP